MPSSPNINNSFFDGLYSQVWKKLIPEGLSEAETDFIEDAASLKIGDDVLDIMCGYGRHSIGLARRKYKVTAIDILEAYSVEIKEKASAENLQLEVITADIRETQLNKTYKAAICMGNSFAFFNQFDAADLLKKISSHLEPDGILIINSWMVAEIAIRHFREKDWFNVDGFKYLLDYNYCFNPSRIESEQTIIPEHGQAEVLKGIDYIYSLSEMENMFTVAGLKTKHLFSTPRKKPFRLGDGHIYMVIEKIK